MDLSTAITMDPEAAKARADELAAGRDHLTEEEHQFLAGYLALAQGRQIVNLVDVVSAGGCFEGDDLATASLPRLAVARSYDHWVTVRRAHNGEVGFMKGGWQVELPRDTLRRLTSSEYATYGYRRAMVPPVPFGIRMRLGRRGGGGWRPCLTLFEVGSWEPVPRPPGDPALLRYLSGHLYTVEATWDLTELERAVLGGMRT